MQKLVILGKTENFAIFHFNNSSNHSMKLAKFITAVLILQSFTGCNNTSEEEAMTVPESTSTSMPAPPTITADTTKLQPVPAQPVIPVTGKSALNPAHGQPGHRCDIAVGAPLDSKPTQPTVNATPQPVAIAPQPASNVAASGGSGLNPAHGQPGHRCDIAVGAPLNSKPNQQAISANPQSAAAPVSQAPPPPKPLINLKPDETAKGPLNPAHGQPGHRCDIAVGAPLNSKPAQ
jgi:hypothetical protein